MHSQGHPAACQLPLPALPLPQPVGRAPGRPGVGGARPGDRCVGGLGGQVALSEAGGCLERMRQTDGVTPKSPRAWLWATGTCPRPRLPSHWPD